MVLSSKDKWPAVPFSEDISTDDMDCGRSVSSFISGAEDANQERMMAVATIRAWRLKRASSSLYWNLTTMRSDGILHGVTRSFLTEQTRL